MPHPSRFQLTVQLGPELGVVHNLTGDLVTIGRYTGNTIVIADEEISRHHARLTRTADGYTIEDLGSSNGLFVNSVRVTHPVLLSSGDLVRLGTSVVMVYEAFESGSVTPIAPRSLPSMEGRFSRPVSDTSGTVYMKKADVLIPPQEKHEEKTFWQKLLGWLEGKKDSD